MFAHAHMRTPLSISNLHICTDPQPLGAAPSNIAQIKLRIGTGPAHVDWRRAAQLCACIAHYVKYRIAQKRVLALNAIIAIGPRPLHIHNLLG